MHVILLEVSVNRGSVQYLMEIGTFSPAQVLCKLNVIHVKVSSRVKNHHFSKFAIFRRLNRAHQELSLKKIPGKNVFSVQTLGVQKFFL